MDLGIFSFSDNCGDEGQATKATLTSPKGITLDSEDNIYFIDGTRIRVVHSMKGTIQTFAGKLAVSGTRQISCQGSISKDQVRDEISHSNRYNNSKTYKQLKMAAGTYKCTNNAIIQTLQIK